MIHVIHAAAGPWSEATWRASWQGAIAVAIGWALCRLLPRMPAALECWVWRAVYLKLLVSLVPLVPVDLPVLHERGAAPSVVTRSENELRQVVRESPQTGAERAQSPVLVSSVVTGWGWREWLMVVWAGGAVAYSIQFILRWHSSVRDRRCSAALQDAWVLSVYTRVARSFGLANCPPLRVSERSAGPRLAGLFWPVLIIPAKLLERPDRSSLELLFAHEVAHYIRRDLWWSWLPAAGRVVFWFHPAVWLAEQQWRLAEESACDQAAIGATHAAPGDYAAMLLEIASQFPARGRPPVQMGIVDSRHTLKRRFIAMRYTPRWSARRRTSFGIAICFAALVALVPWQLVAQAENQPKGNVTEAPGSAEGTSSRPALRPPLHDRDEFDRNRASPNARHAFWQRDNELSGRVEAPFADVSARAAGVVTGVKTSEGQGVKQGDLLFVLDDARAKAALAEAEAQLRKAELAYDTKAKLVKSHAVTQEDVEFAAADRDVAVARFRIA